MRSVAPQRVRVVGALFGLTLGLGCSVSDDAGSGVADAAAAPTATPAPTVVPVTSAPLTPAPTAIPTATPTATPTPTGTVAAPSPTPEFVSDVRPIDDVTLDRMTPTSWRPGCPVAPDDLRLVSVTHIDFSGASVQGELVIHRDHAEPVADAFGAIYRAGFPIESMVLVDTFGGDDGASMRANNTSAFNCREVAWRPGVWSNHALGTAIDINPLINPYVRGDFVDPPEGAPFVSREDPLPGQIVEGDAVVEAFATIGWTWGGRWVDAKDYQHFSAQGD